MKCPICHKLSDHFTKEDFGKRDIDPSVERVSTEFDISVDEAKVFVHMWDKHFLSDDNRGCKCGYNVSFLTSTWADARDHVGEPPIDHWTDIVLGAV